MENRRSVGTPLRHKIHRGGRMQSQVSRTAAWLWELLRPYSVALYFVLAFVYLELMFRVLCGFSDVTNLAYPLLFALPAGFLFALLSGLLPRKWNVAVSIVLTSAVTVGYMTQFIYRYIFKVHLTMYSVSVGVGQAMGFSGAAFSAIIANILPLLLLAVPLVFLCVFGRKWFNFARGRWFRSLAYLGAFLLLQLSLLLAINLGGKDLYSPYDLYYNTNSVDMGMERLGFLTTTRLDIQRLLFGFEADKLQLELEPEPSESSEEEHTPASDPSGSSESSEHEPGGASSSESESVPEPVPEVDTSPNVTDIDFEALIANAPNDTVKTMHEYFSVQTPTNKNEYTGMFEGYNLIMLTAEGFSRMAVDEKLTPTLYRMVNGGFHFSNFYTPIWGVSTSDGEYVACTGLLPKSGVWSFYRSGAQGNDMQYCLGNMFGARDYLTMAYHDHTYSYYGRDVSHPNMGYTYKGVGSGLDVATTWPESDLEMMEKTVPEYINAEQFHTYYMTVSGHLYYTFEGNSMATKNRELVEDLPLSEEAKAYLACNIELDKALEYLVNALDKAGKLEKTVFVLSPDHYPYGLAKETIDELVGHTVEETFELYKTNLIIWSASMEEPIEIAKPCCSLDIIPTVLNLFGFDYDSRLLMGRDILSDAEPLVIFADTSFITDRVMYRAGTGEIIMLDGSYEPVPDGEVDLPEKYITNMQVAITNKFKMSTAMLDNDYYSYIE